MRHNNNTNTNVYGAVIIIFFKYWLDLIEWCFGKYAAGTLHIVWEVMQMVQWAESVVDIARMA